MYRRDLFVLVLAASFPAMLCIAQSEVTTEPTVGLRENPPRMYAFINAEVVVEPGHSLSGATILVEGPSIVAAGSQVQVPPGYQTIDCSGKRVYPGLIDAWSEVDVPNPSAPAAYWNGNVMPHRRAASVAGKSSQDASKLRSQGVTTRVIAPRGGIVKGSSCIVLLSNQAAGRKLLKESAWQHLQLSVPRTGSRPRYPNSPMGAVALLRQSLYDANWYRQAWETYHARTELPRPETNLALGVLAGAIRSSTFVIDAPNERMALRADQLASEFSLKMILRGSGREYRQLDEIVSTHRPILVPVDFPETPNLETSELARNTTLQELMHWDLAPENPGRLVAAGASICLTTDGLDDVGDFLKQVRVAVERGLPPDSALAALTTQPAQWLGIDDHTGRIRPGMLANLVVTSGDLLSDDTKVLECWVAGEQFVIDREDPGANSPAVGRWSLQFSAAQRSARLEIEITQEKKGLSGRIRSVNADANAAEDDQAMTKLKNVAVGRDRITATVNLGNLDTSLPEGVSQLTLMTVASESSHDVFASITLPDATPAPVNIRAIEEEQTDTAASSEEPPDDDAREGDNNDPDSDDPDNDDPDNDNSVSDQADDNDAASEERPDTSDEQASPTAAENEDAATTPVLFPLGAYGLTQRLVESSVVLFRGATVWTCEGDAGPQESVDILIRDGLIAEIGPQLAVPAGCQIIDARGKHITPGLIDCHSHMGTDGGVNESGQVVTSEVRIADFIDNSDILIYRQAAGGLTTSNILHGSANPIGGQNQVIKLRWGETMEGLRMKEAPAGIKFALGENVKRTESRYPNTRMGVEQVLRDSLLAAREYDAKWRRWKRGVRDSLPPRTDLQLEALAEVQRGERWIHCHSYRQDEIIATLDVLEEFGIQIGTLQHILEGYKVADRMAEHGAMGSSFSDWWAYKFEVFDAIPYNGALMHDRGVVVSFNSDDRELARHLNTEAAKATKYGAVTEAEALKFVTLNPAKQLRIDQYVGSLAVGKHADLVVWSGRPLSTLSRCEQTWIDGRKYFDLQSDQQLRRRDAQLRARLIQKVLSEGDPPKKRADEQPVAEEDRWVRYDIFCSARGSTNSERGGQKE